jgi:hypothetical protein
MVADNIIETVESYSLDDIEPFTMVVADWNTILKFYELVWDGTQKHFKELPLEPRIWSSATLYSESMQEERQQWFEEFKILNNLDAENLQKFHNMKDDNNMEYGIIMNRGFVKTTSVTQVEKCGNAIAMRYKNLENKTLTHKTFKLSQVVNG